MIETFAKIVLAEGVEQAISLMLDKIKNGIFPAKDRKSLITAITAIQKATIKTRNFITDSGYQRNEELTDLWHDALNKVVEANIEDNLPEYLYQKAKFWGEPKQWILSPETLELIPKLSYIDEKCDMLMLEVKKGSNGMRF